MAELVMLGNSHFVMTWHSLRRKAMQNYLMKLPGSQKIKYLGNLKNEKVQHYHFQTAKSMIFLVSMEQTTLLTLISIIGFYLIVHEVRTGWENFFAES